MKLKGRPAGETPKAVIKHLLTMAPPSNLPEEDSTPEYHHVSDVFIDNAVLFAHTFWTDLWRFHVMLLCVLIAAASGFRSLLQFPVLVDMTTL